MQICLPSRVVSLQCKFATYKQQVFNKPVAATAVKAASVLLCGFFRHVAYPGVEGGVTKEDIIGVSVTFFFVQDAFEDLP